MYHICAISLMHTCTVGNGYDGDIHVQLIAVLFIIFQNQDELYLVIENDATKMIDSKSAEIEKLQLLVQQHKEMVRTNCRI